MAVMLLKPTQTPLPQMVGLAVAVTLSSPPCGLPVKSLARLLLLSGAGVGML